MEHRRPAHVIVFGSQVRGDALRDRSDLDLTVVSQEFAGMPFLRPAGEVPWTLRASFAPDVLCYTPEEFRRKREELGVVRIAAEQGGDLLCRTGG